MLAKTRNPSGRHHLLFCTSIACCRAEARGEARSSLLATWCSLIHPPPCCHAHPLGSLHAPAVDSFTLAGGQPTASKTDPDWQQLPHPPTAHTSSEGALNGSSHQSKAATPGGGVSLSRSCTGIGEPMFLDLEAQPHQALTFREVFLRSRALENLIAGESVDYAPALANHHPDTSWQHCNIMFAVCGRSCGCRHFITNTCFHFQTDSHIRARPIRRS